MKVVSVTGYFGTGSSAVLDLLNEYEGVSRVPIDRKIYEHVPFYVHGGLFDLCTLLLHGNTTLRSDAVLNAFVSSMEKVNKYDFGWFGAYSNQFKDGFSELTKTFINKICSTQDSFNLNHCLYSRISVYHTLRTFIAKNVLGRERKLPVYTTVYDHNPVYFAIPNRNELMAAARDFTNGYFNLFPVKEGSEIEVFDHLIWPNQIDEYGECFSEDVKFIVVERDPRDLYLLCKYFYSTKGIKPFFPTEPTEFVDLWKRFFVRKYCNRNVIRIQFEDMVYNYDYCISKIESFLGLDHSQNIFSKKFFNPIESIENTQVFNVNEDWKNEVEIIKEKLKDDLFDFPYERVPNFKLMFDR